MDMNYRGGMWEEGVGRMEWSEGGKWDNCNSIINTYIKKKDNFFEQIMKENFLNIAKETDINPGSSVSPKEVRPKEEHTKTHHN